MASPLVYLVLGSKGSGQFSIVADLIEFGAGKDEVSAVYCSANDKDEAEADLIVKSREANVRAYEWRDGALALDADLAADLVFVVADGLADPADFVESFHGWLQESGCELGRVLTVVDCELAASNSDALHWYDGCIHFSDVVLLANRANVKNRQIQDFLNRYKEQYYPCYFEYVKKGRVPNPSLVLENQPRRISRIFEAPEVFEDDLASDIEEESVAGDPSKDPFLKRDARGRRVLKLPDIGKLLK